MMSQSSESHIVIDGVRYYDAANQPLHFVRVNVDCWERIFDYLSLHDILAMSQTCKRMSRIGGYYFCENFRSVSCELVEKKCRICMFELEQMDFLRSIETLHIFGGCHDLNELHTVFLNMDSYHSLTTIILHFVDLDENRAHQFESLLNNVTSIELYKCTIHGDFFENFLKYCSKLKCLRADHINFHSHAVVDGLFLRELPMLQYLQYVGDAQNVKLRTFLEKNPNLKYFELDAHHIWMNRVWLIQSKFQLDCLAINFCSDGLNSRAMPTIQFANLLKTLYANGSYKKLHLSIGIQSNFDNQTFADEMVSLNALKVWKFMGHSENYIDLTRLIQLQELHISGQLIEADLKTIATNLTELQRLYLYGHITTDYILQFLRHSRTLKVIALQGSLCDDLNLFILNQEREKLKHAHKVLIGADQSTYLSMKWKAKNLNLRLVEIVRTERVEYYFDDISYFKTT